MLRTKKTKKRITTQSAKSKGRELQKWVCMKISELTGFEWGTAGDDKPIESRGMGQPGVDVRLERKVERVFPFSVECKRQESMSVPAWVKQAKENKKEGTDWLLVCKRSREKPIIIMDAESFFNLLNRP